MTTTSSERELPAARHAGQRIHALIWERRLKQGSIAQAVGIGSSTFSKKLRGEVPITVDELMTIAGVLGVDPGELLPRLDSNQQPSGYPSAQVSDVTDLRSWRTTRARASPIPRQRALQVVVMADQS